MNKTLSLIKINLKNNMKSVALVFAYLGISSLCTIVIALVGAKSIVEPILNSGSIDSELLNVVIGFLGYCTMLLVSGIEYSVLFSSPLIREKTCGNIESLLATPTSQNKIWISKTLALYIPGIIVGTIFSLVITGIMNSLCIEKDFNYKPNEIILIATYILLPIIYFALSLFMNLLGLIARVADASVVGIIFVSGVTTVVINLVAKGNIKADSIMFLMINLLLTIVLFVLSIILYHKLTIERIVLSCKE